MADTDTDSLHDTNLMYIPEKTGKFTVEVRQLNESFCELYRPKDRLPTMQVLFFHGFQREYENAHLFTWTCGDESGLWPQTWLVEKFPNAHILSVSYYGGKLQEILKKYKDQVDVDMSILVENLISDLQHAKIGQEPRCPVVLVGHSFGGLIVKQLCVNAFKQLGDTRIVDETRTRLRSFVDNVKAVFFYATPHHGIEDKSMKLLDPALLIPSGPLLEDVKILSKYAARLNGDFDRHLKQQKWRIAGLGESTPSNWGRWSHGRLIVAEGSSRCYEDFTIALGEDHISISRPKSKITRSFTAVESLLKDIGDNPQLFERPGNLQYLPESICGIEGVLTVVKHKLKTATKLGFVGMGGIGKTTLAMSLFNAIEKSYNYTCFIADVKSLLGPKDTKVEDAMLKRLHHGGMRLKKEPRGLNFLKEARLLLVLDDVKYEEDLQIVRILCDLPVHKDSRFIATSRDPDLFKTNSHEVYKVGLLSLKSAKELFVSHAFLYGSIPSALKSFIPDIVDKCGRLPLTLVVIGKHLQGKREAYWKEAIIVLDKAKNAYGFYGKLWAILKLSFDGLESKEEKDVFLDAATVFYKSELSKAKVAWRITTDGLQDGVWERLVQLSLVWEVQEMGKVTIGMHEQIWSLGKTLASSPLDSGCNCRIWNDSEKALSLLCPYNDDMDGLKDISALKCCKGQLEMYRKGMTSTSENRISISGMKLRKMTNLQYLWLEGFDIEQTHGLQLAPTVVNLHLSSVNFSGFTFNSYNHYLMNILEIAGCGGLSELPSDTFVRLPELEHIELHDTSLQNIPDLGTLRSLKTLRLNWVPTAKFPSLPECLKDEVREVNFPGPFLLKVEGGNFIKDYEVVRVQGLPKYPIGLEERAQEVREALKSTCVLGIYGMGGIGKTTLAKEVYNHIANDFDYTCFVGNVKGIRHGALEEAVLRCFCKNGKKIERADWMDMKEKQTLIVMDEIDSEDQLRVLPTLEHFGSGSRIIITSRETVLWRHENYGIYYVKLLGRDEATKLFCLHAFGVEDIPNHLNESVTTLVRKCGSLPLTLELIGCNLRGQQNNRVIWDMTIDNLGPTELREGHRLALSVCLFARSHEEQQMFIEAGDFFFERELEEALAAWSTTISHPVMSWSNLVRSSLVKLGSEERPLFFRGGPSISRQTVWVDEVLRKMARFFSVLYSSGSDELLALLNENQMNDHTGEEETMEEGTIGLRLQGTSIPVKVDSLLKLEKLRYLEMSDVNVHGEGLGKRLPSKLAMLRWTNSNSESNKPLFPIALDEMNHLAVLELSGWAMPQGTLEALGSLSNMRKLTLQDLTGVHSLPENFGKLRHLKILTLSHLSLQRFPESFGNLEALEHLVLESIDCLELPEFFGNLSSLVTLDIGNCRGLASIPLLTSLKHLRIYECPLLVRLPESFFQLPELIIEYL